MPVLLVFAGGLVVGSLGTYFVSDGAGKVLKWGAIAGGVYVGGKYLKVW